jgi:hypothetical protein
MAHELGVLLAGGNFEHAKGAAQWRPISLSCSAGI